MQESYRALPPGLKPLTLLGLTGTAKAVPFPFVLEQSSQVVSRRGKPRLYARCLCSL